MTTENTTTPTDNQQPVETQQEINWKQFREAREKDREEKMAAQKRAAEKEAEAAALKAAMESLLNKPQQQQNDEDTSEDEKIQRKVEEAIAKKEQQYQFERQKKEAEEYPSRLNQAYPDFHKVCSAENCDYLEYHYPFVTSAFQHMPDGFEKWSQIYQAIKRFIPNADTKSDQKKIEENAKKPQSMSSKGVSQTGDNAPYMLDEKRKSDNWARMKKIMGKM